MSDGMTCLARSESGKPRFLRGRCTSIPARSLTARSSKRTGYESTCLVMNLRRSGHTILYTCPKTSNLLVQLCLAYRSHLLHVQTTPTRTLKETIARCFVHSNRGQKKLSESLPVTWISLVLSFFTSPSKRVNGSALNWAKIVPSLWPWRRGSNLTRSHTIVATPRILSTRSICSWGKSMTLGLSNSTRVFTTMVGGQMKIVRSST
mmetsp:Transcript_40280/g.93322  ORF Transcript_40280/g.93322 Transcript_40280/m.93322 type:complete len:206 (+) Transcript_40280:2523-3140(+)